MSNFERVRALFEHLPGPASWSAWVGFIVVETGNYKPFMVQCLKNSNNRTQSAQGGILVQHKRQAGGGGKRTGASSNASALNKALGWARWAQIHCRVMVGLYIYHLFKYRILALVTTEPALAHLHYLDCFIPGRFRFVGRANKISGEIASTFLLWFLIYRLLIEVRVPNFKFFVLEFLVTSRAEVAENELKASPDGTLVLEQEEGSAKGRRERCVNSIFYLRSPFRPQENKWILRPNRTRDSWLALNLYFKAIFYWSFLVLFGWFAVIYWALAGSMLTNLGFEMSYPACAAWLREVQSAPHSAQNYSYIYLAPRVLAHEIRIDDIPARIPLNLDDLQSLTLHSFVRIAFDLAGNHLLYLEYALLFSTQFYLLVIQSIDVGLNAAGIRDRLVRLIVQLDVQRRLASERLDREQVYARLLEMARNDESGHSDLEGIARARPLTSACSSRIPQSYLRPAPPPPPPRGLRPPPLRMDLDELTHEETALSEETANLQAILADHFDNLTRGYNAFISMTLPCMSLCWLHYTLILCSWISSVKSRAVELEFLVAETMVTFFCVVIMSGSALVRSRNLKLYPLITRAMALDPDWSLTKPRWATIIKYFHPRPFYCFTVIGSTEISWLFCLKLLSWILSAFILLANFFYMNRF